MHSDAPPPSGAPGSRPPATGVYRIERLSPANRTDMVTLFHAVYGENNAAPDFDKKFDTAFAGATDIGYFAYDHNNQPAAYYGVMPCLIQHGDKIILAAQSGDTMTHPAHRNKGLFVRLCNMTVDLCRETNIRLLFGFPNQNSFPGFVGKLGWTTIENLDCFTIPVSTLPLVGLTRRLPFLSGLLQAWTRYTLRPLLTGQQGLPNSSPDGIHRNDAYFQYRTYSPTQVIRLGNAKAWVRISNNFIIGDLQLNRQDFDQTLRLLRKLAARLGHRTLFFHSSRGTLLHDLFADRFPSIPSFPIIYKDLGAGIPIHELKFTFSDIDTF